MGQWNGTYHDQRIRSRNPASLRKHAGNCSTTRMQNLSIEPTYEVLGEPAAEPVAEPPAEPAESFADLLSEFERSHTHKPASGARQLEGTVVSLSAEQVFLDIGYKTEGVLPRCAFREQCRGASSRARSSPSPSRDATKRATTISPASKSPSLATGPRSKRRSQQKLAVVGTVTGVVKGGFTVDIGVRAFMPASRSGTRDAAELEKLVGTEITCRITKLDVTDEDVVVDRRVVLEEQARALQEGRYRTMQPGRHAQRNRSQPHALWRLRRSRRNRRSPSRQRHLLEPRQQARRRAHRRPGNPGPHSQDRSGDEKDLARPQAASTRAMGCRARQIPGGSAHHRHRHPPRRLRRVC